MIIVYYDYLMVYVVCVKLCNVMNCFFFLFVVVVFFVLVVCNFKFVMLEVIDMNLDLMVNMFVNVVFVELLLVIKFEQIMCCKDNSFVYVIFFQGVKQVVICLKEGGLVMMLKVLIVGELLVVEGGWLMIGDEKIIILIQFGKGVQFCYI